MTESRASDIFQIGDLLNNTYRIESVLGRGGTSEVYRARSDISNKVVAIKALRSEFARNEDYLVLMTREEDIREIRHDAIVRYYDTQRTNDGSVYLVMDYVEGPGLDKMIAQGGMSAEDVLTVGARVCEGLVAAHSKNIIHRDLSPDNIILRGGDPAAAVIIDFGIAKDANPGAATIVGNEFAGKYAYAAPEQLSGQTDARADIYALGALLLATYRGKQPESGANLMEVVHRKALPLDTEGVPEPLKSILDHMTEPDREHRAQSAAEVLAMIRAGQEHTDGDVGDRTVIVPPRTTPPPRPATATPAPPRKPAPAAAPVPAEPRRRGGRGGLIATLLVVLIAAAGGGAWFTGALDGLFGPSYPPADPYALVVEYKGDGSTSAVGNVPSPEIRDALAKAMSESGGQAALTLASGAIGPDWGAGILKLYGEVKDLPQWRIAASGNQVKVTGMTLDPAQRQRMLALLQGDGMPAGFEGSADIALGPAFVSADALTPILRKFSDCGDLHLADPPAAGYPHNAVIAVVGNVADTSTRVRLTDAITAMAGDREVKIEGDVLNPTLCLVNAALPHAPSDGFKVSYSFGSHPGDNPTGRYFVGENPVIDVTIPADVTTGYLFVSALDVSGNVFHLLPNLNREDNSIVSLRGGQPGPVKVRVAYPQSQADNGKRLAFLVDASTLGKTRILVIHAESQIFGGLRPTTESAGAYAEALKERTGPVKSLDSSILTTVAKP